jgi:hypothetical protein
VEVEVDVNEGVGGVDILESTTTKIDPGRKALRFEAGMDGIN